MSGSRTKKTGRFDFSLRSGTAASDDSRRGIARRGPFALLAAALLLLWWCGLADTATALTLAPANGQSQVCVDGPLSINFDTPPRLGSSGVIRVFRNDGTLVDTIDLADPNSSKRTVGNAVSDSGVVHLWRYSPVIIAGNTASIYLHAQLDYGATYYVVLDSSVLTDGQGFAGIQDPQAWRFTTRGSPPPAGTNVLTVAADGSGDFCSVQGAIDFVPVNNTQHVDINVKSGTYTELVYVVPSKPFITVRGEDRDRTIIQYTNNDTLNVLPFTTAADPNNQCINRRIPGTPDLWNCWRALFGVEANDFTLENITLHNTTPPGGSQAEAFRGNADRTTLNRVRLLSYQDTTRIQGSVFVTNSYVEGDVDFTWGVGAVFFQESQLNALRSGYYSTVRSDTNHGNVYFHDRFTRAASLAPNTMYLSRIEWARFPNAETVFISNVMDDTVRAVGFNLIPATCPNPVTIKLWEYKSVDPTGALIDTSQRLACSHPMTDQEAATWSDPAFVLNGWVPNTINATPVGQLVGPTPAAVAGGSSVRVNWSAPVGHSVGDWVGLYPVGASDQSYVARQFAPAATLGSFVFALPIVPGRYEFRYFSDNSMVKLASSNAVTVAGVRGDLNADNVVNCQDLTMAAGAVGRRAGQAGFLPLADIDLSGTIDIRDISAISRMIAPGTHC